MANVSFYLHDVLDDVAVRTAPAGANGAGRNRILVARDVPRNLTGDRDEFGRILSVLIGLGSECAKPGNVAVDIDVARGGFDSGRRAVNLRAVLRGSGAGLTCREAADILVTFLGDAAHAGDGSPSPAHESGVELLDRMGAGIALEKAPGAGFAVSLTAEFGIEPVAAGESGGMDRGKARRGPKPEFAMPEGLDRLRGARILLAEDHPVNQSLTREILHQAGCSVEIAEDGQKTVDAVRERGDAFSAILMDVQMPIMDGFEATRRIRSDLGRTELPIIAMTANVLGDERQRCLDAGMDDYVPKPIHIPNIYAALLRWIKPVEVGADDDVRPAQQSGGGAPSTDDVYVPDRIAGIDIASGLSRAMGNRALYLSLLAQFAKGNETLGKEVAASIAKGDPDRARFLVHGLASTAGNLGATRLYAAACELETALVKNSDNTGELLPAFLDRLQEALVGIRESGVSLDGAPVRLGDGQQPLDRREAARTAETLRAMLEDQDMGAHQQADKLLELFGGRGQDERLRSLKAQVDALDFSEAKEILADICEDVLN